MIMTSLRKFVHSLVIRDLIDWDCFGISNAPPKPALGGRLKIAQDGTKRNPGWVAKRILANDARAERWRSEPVFALHIVR